MKNWIERQGLAARVTAIMIAAVILLSPGLVNGYIITHSSLFNTVWAEGFAAELARGHPYPRYLPEINDGRGSPVFYFYAPLPFYLTAPFVWLTGNAGLATIMGSAVMLGLSGLAGYALLREFAGRAESTVLALAYMAMPYHLAVDIWVRGAYGEQASFIFLPLALLCLLRMKVDLRYAAGLAAATAGQVLSHLPSTLVYGVILAGFSLWQAWCERSWRLLLLAAAAGAAGLAGAAAYLVPAFSARPFISPQFWGAYAPADFYLGQVRRPFDVIMLAGFLPSLAAFAVSLRLLRGARSGPRLAGWIGMGAAILFLVSPLAIPLWRHAGPFQAIQFPWRALAAFDLVISVLAAAAWQRQQEGIAPVLRILALGIALNAAAAAWLRHAAGPEQGAPLRVSEAFESERLALKADGLEYLPRCTVVPDSFVLGPLSTALLLEDYRAKPAPSGTLRSFYYPFLEFTAGGRVLAASCDPGSGLARVEGLLADGTPVTVVARPLPEERAAGYASLAGLLVIALLWLLPILHRNMAHGTASRAK